MKTKPEEKSVADFISSIGDEQERADCYELLDLMATVTGEKPKMWGESIVGFGSYHYKYATGKEGDCYLTGFSPRKKNLTIYIMSGFENYQDLMKDLGKYKTSVSCLYVKKLSDIDKNKLTQLIKKSIQEMSNRYK